MSDSNVQIEEVYKRVPFFPTNWDDYDKCPVCNSVLKNGKKMAKIYSNGELIEEDVLLPLKICQTCDIGYGTPQLIEYIHTVYRKMHINPMQLRKNDIGNGNVNDIKLRIQMQNSFHNKHKSKNRQYPEVDKLLGIIQKRKDKQIKGSLSKYMGISNDEKNTIHKKNEEHNVIPTDAQIYVGNSEQHVCLGKMTGSVRLTNRVLACKGKIYLCNIKQCLRCKKYFISPRDFYSNSSLPDNYTYIEPGDIVYIYVSGNVKAIKFKCRVNKADLDESDIDDREYDLSGQFDGTAGRYMELELLEEYVGDEYSREELMKHGFRSPQGPIRMPESVKQYLESISVFEHRYPVNTAVWIATALLSAESFDSNPVCSKKDMYFKQTAIIQRAQKLAESSVANARCSQWCCADNDNSSNNYLRGDSEENSSLRRLSLLDEFPEKTHPEGLNMADELTMNGNKITMEELFYFVREQYPTIIGNDSKIDYIGVLDYLRDNTDVPYSKPDAPGLAAEEVSRLLEVKKKGQNAIAELKKMAEAFAVRFKLEKCMSMSWLDGSNTKTRRYLWAPLKYGKYADNPVSVSVFVEKRNSDTCYRVSLEIKNDGDDKDIMKQYHSHLDIPLNVAAGLVYVSVSGSNEWGTPDILNKTQDEIKQEVESGKLKKVQICKYIDRKPDETNAYYHTEITKAIAAILPYYDHVLGIEKIEYYPSLAEYDPGITAEEYERILGDENIVKSAWLDTLHYLYLMGGIGTCKQIANKYGNGAAHYNTNAINVAKAVHKETNCPLCARDTGENQYWPVLFYGRDLADSADGVFSYKMREPLMEAIKALEERGVLQEMKEANKEFDKNLILYGPPGTGKTYNSATYAVAICDEKSVDELTDYDAVMKRYNELKEAGRIAFTTFHQSYGYEEFIEGIKPVVDDEATDISYTIESGVFKKFCDIAGTPENMEIDHNAQVWFVRLNGVGKNDLKEECFKEGTIRFSWENENVDDSYKKWFNMMSPGDYVVSYNGANVNIDGIGIIEDSEPFYDEQRSSFKWTRKVKWLVTDIVENIRELNGGKYLPNFEITKLNRVRISELLELVSKHGGYAGEKLEAGE